MRILFTFLLIYSITITLQFFSREGAEVRKMNEYRMSQIQTDSLIQVISGLRDDIKEQDDIIRSLNKSIGDREDEISYLGHRYDKVKIKLDSLGYGKQNKN